MSMRFRAIAATLALGLLPGLTGCAAPNGQQQVNKAERDPHHSDAHVHSRGGLHHHHPWIDPHDHRHDLTTPGAAGLEHTVLHPSHDPQAPCACIAAKAHHRWCPRCNVGYVAGRRIESARLFEVLDPHGHEIMVGSPLWAGCRSAFEHDGYCDEHGIGFVDQHAYFTRLTYQLALGRTIDPAGLRCDACRTNSADSGWCNHCGRGLVGNVLFVDRAVYDRAQREFRVLLNAIDRSKVCEVCPLAMVTHRTCPTCMISYESDDRGEPISTGPRSKLE